jgi:hypothetical protein
LTGTRIIHAVDPNKLLCEELWAFSVFPPHHLSALTVKMSQTAMNIAAITGPKTNPLIPKIEIPPSVENSTT